MKGNRLIFAAAAACVLAAVTVFAAALPPDTHALIATAGPQLAIVTLLSLRTDHADLLRRAGEVRARITEGMAQEEAQRLEETNHSLQHEVNLLRQRLSLIERSSSSLAESKDQESARAKAQSKELERALEEAKEENTKRVAETTQFQQMRKIMQSQSAKIRDLRKRLQKYEPDAVKEDDDDDA